MPLQQPLQSLLGWDGANAVTAPAGTSANIAAALSRLALQFKDQPNLGKLITALASQTDAPETALQQLTATSVIRQSVGAQLDNLGKILGEPRQGFDDGIYQLHLLARIWLNRGSGTAEHLYNLFELLVPGYQLQISEYPPASLIFRVRSNIPPVSGDYLNAILQQARAAGVRAHLHFLNAPQTSTFSFDGGSGVGFENGTWSSAIG